MKKKFDPARDGFFMEPIRSSGKVKATTERREGWQRHAGEHRPVTAVACPICHTLDVIHEATRDRGDFGAEEAFRCANDHQWTHSRSRTGRLDTGSFAVSGMPHPDYQTAAIHCPRCGREATYRGILRGECICTFCGYASEHALDWPADAFYAVEVGGEVLWAWTRDHAEALRDFLASAEREPNRFPRYERFLRHIPGQFLGAKQRDAAVRRLKRLLAASS